ncbi:MAG: alpha/beta hydrolase family protein [Pseudomonadota bacterium]
MTDFVLLHGAWHGGWCWGRVAEILRARGHRVTTPTQTGLGERAHLLSPDITLTTFCEDLRLHIEFEGHSDAVLVGHSFGGSPISYAAERAADRVARLVYLDAIMVYPGETPFSHMAPDVVALRRQLAADSSGGLSLPPPPAAAMGVTDKSDAAWLERMMTPHPLATFETPLDIAAVPGGTKPASYVMCTDPIYSPLETSRARAHDLGMTMAEIAAGHDAMVTAPAALADILEAG